MLLFYVRHGDPIYSPDSLTPLGRRQAEAVAKRLSLYGIDRIFASPCIRAQETAQPTSEITKKKIEVLDVFSENLAAKDFFVRKENGDNAWVFDVPDFARLFLSREIYNMGEKWYEHPKLKDYTFKQGIERINSGLDEFIRSLGYEHIREEGVYKAVEPNNKRIAIFAHQGFGANFLSSLLDIPYPQISTHFDISHSNMTVINFADTSDGIVIPKVLTLSNDSHIYREGLPTRYNNSIPF